MKIGELLTADRIALQQKADSREEVIKLLTDLVCERGLVTKKDKLFRSLTDRESEGSTGIGTGIAIPHCMTAAVKKPLLFAMTLEKPVDFDSYDGKPVDLVFMIATPDNGDKSGMEIMSSLSLLLTDDAFAENLRGASDADEFMEIVKAADSGEKSDVKKTSSSKKKTKLAAVCACPNGTVKSVQAAENLEKSAAKAGCVIKIEKRSAKSSESILSAGDIADAKAVIIASDIDVPMDRFDGKRIVKCTTEECAMAPEKYIEKAVSGKESQFDAAKAKKERAVPSAKTGANMGIAGFIATVLPFFTGAAVVACFAAVMKMTGNFGGLFAAYTSGGKTLAVGIVIAVLAGFVSSLIAGDEGLATGFFGGMLIVWYNTVAGIVCAVIVGLLSGVFILLLKKLFGKIPAKLTWLKNIILIPVTGITIEAVIICFVLNGVALSVVNAVMRMIAGV